MNHADFLCAVQSRAARIAVGATAARGRGNRGVVPAAREFLRQMDLSPFNTNDPARFKAVLDPSTERLRAALPKTARHWGLARKLLNIFLRDCLYTTHLNTAYHLDRAEDLYEVPLDSITGTRLKRAAGRGVLPVWPGVRYLTPNVSIDFQRVASDLARREDIARVHLDAVYWSLGRDDAKSD